MGYCYEFLKKRLSITPHSDKHSTIMPLVDHYATLFLPNIIQAQEACNLTPVKNNNIFFINTGSRSRNNYCFALSLAEVQQLKPFIADPNNEGEMYKLNGIPEIEKRAINYSTLGKEQKEAIDFLSIKKIELDSLYSYFNTLYDILLEVQGIVYTSELAKVADFPIYIDNLLIQSSWNSFSELNALKNIEAKKKIYFSDSTMQRIDQINLLAAILRSQG